MATENNSSTDLIRHIDTASSTLKHMGNPPMDAQNMSTINMEAYDTLSNRLAQVTSILDMLFLAGSDCESMSLDQMTDGLWPARELLKQATDAAERLRMNTSRI